MKEATIARIDAQAPTLKELVKRAEDLQPLLRKNAVESELSRRAAEENITAIQEAGLFRLMVPNRLGGYQGTLRSHLEVSATLAEACGGTAWVVALNNVCAWFTGLCSEQAQNDIYALNPDARVAGVLSTSPISQRVEGGLRISGKWYSSSGILHADWASVGVDECNAHGVVVGRFLALLPKSDYSIEDTWFTAGMRASGSNCIVVNDVFIPNHRLLNLGAAIEGEYATEFKEEAAYRAQLIPVASLTLNGPTLGMGRAALKYVIDSASRRAVAYTSFEKQSQSVAFQMQIAEAALKIDTAHLRAYRAADEVDEAARQGLKLDALTRARIRADVGLINTLIIDAINILLSAHGAGSFAETSPMQRWWRDANAAARHAIALPAVGSEIYGKALLGVENTVTPLV
ncbi:oxidoreductase [Pseudomonas sp. MAFF 301449]|uniref:Oxidoreductase n=1 Tax=Pseudomonas cyclaminis TaxID=2781239 RepID=A0ABR9SPW2_9PSED|nr:acyl-CoA dehydrogenase family protein [Pseudomonas cyclaminis]MBE8590933.1 oxidoreductase [Pseudomonas cyclaminis]MBE8598629.1 oxidoreductase [Pseudomonas cyclaminis]